jgi:hypothetical protein
VSARKRRPAQVSDLRPAEQEALLGRLAERRDAVGEWASDHPREAFGQALSTRERHRQGLVERQTMRDPLATCWPGWERDVDPGR